MKSYCLTTIAIVSCASAQAQNIGAPQRKRAANVKVVLKDEMSSEWGRSRRTEVTKQRELVSSMSMAGSPMSMPTTSPTPYPSTETTSWPTSYTTTVSPTTSYTYVPTRGEGGGVTTSASTQDSSAGSIAISGIVSAVCAAGVYALV